MAGQHSGVQSWHPGMAFEARVGPRIVVLPAGEPVADDPAEG